MPSPNLEGPLPGERWFHRLHNAGLRVGVLTGVYLSIVMVAAVLLANRSPWLENFADIRNWAARIVFALVLLIPILRFMRSAARLIAAGMLGWFLATITYASLGIFFDSLYRRLPTPGQFFMLGAMVYGIAAVVSWVTTLVLSAREHHLHAIAAARRDIN
jgi:cation transport ATPase